MTDCEHYPVDLVLTPDLMHYGKYICHACGSFRGWAPNPKTAVKEQANIAAIHGLKNAPLSEWEKGFILSLEKQGKHFSPKQQAMLDKLAEKHTP